MGQNALSQSDCKMDYFPEQIDEIASFFCMLIEIHKS